MKILRPIPAAIALIATMNLGGTLEHAGLYGYASGRYILTRLGGNQGQANLDWALEFQTICGDFNEGNGQRKNEAACHSACANRPERKYLPDNDEEPEV